MNVLLLLAAPLFAAPERAFDGPVPSADWNPAHSLYFNLRPESAETLPAHGASFGFSLARTNSMEGTALADGGRGLLHAETTRLELALKFGLTDKLEASFLLPVLARSPADLDNFIGWVERASWMHHMMPSRTRYQGTPMAYETTVPGKPQVRTYGTTAGLGDPAFTLKLKLLDESRWGPAAALRAGLKFPVGDPRLGFGSGTADVSAGLALEKTLTQWLKAYFNLMAAMPTDPSPYVQAFTTASLALEAMVGPVSITLQFDSMTSPYKGTGVTVLDGRDDLALLAVRLPVPFAGPGTSFGVFAAENMHTFPHGTWAGSADDFTIGALFATDLAPVTSAR